MTLIEVIAVLLIIGVASTVVLSRVMDVTTVESKAEVSVIRHHIRFAQAIAMKQNNTLWGIKCGDPADISGTDNHYWLFSATESAPTTGVDTPKALPGAEDGRVLAETTGAFTVYFDGYGIPYTYDSGAGALEKVSSANPLTIAIGTTSISVTPETGYIE